MIDRKLLLDSAGYVDYDGHIYAGSIICNSVFCLEKEKGTIELIYIDDTVPYNTATFSKCARIGNIMLFAPLYGRQLILYDVSNKKVTANALGFLEDEYIDMAKFWEVAVCGPKFYVLGHEIPGIIVVDSSSGEVSYFDDVFNCFTDKQEFFFMDGYALIDKALFFAGFVDATLIRFDTDTNSAKAIKISNKAFKPLSISGFQNEIWMTFCERKAACCLIWNVETENSVEVIFPEEGKWFAPVFYEGWAYFFPADSESHLYRVSLDEHSIELFDVLDRLFMNKSGNQILRDKFTQMVNLNGNRLLFIRFPDWAWIEYDFQTGKFSEKVYAITDSSYVNKYYEDLYSSIYDSMTENNKCIDEKYIPLDAFLSKLREK